MPRSDDGHAAPCKRRIAQVAPCDARHTLATLCRSSRHLDRHSGPIHVYVFEEEPEGIARHLLLLSVMLDSSLPARERVQVSDGDSPHDHHKRVLVTLLISSTPRRKGAP